MTKSTAQILAQTMLFKLQPSLHKMYSILYDEKKPPSDHGVFYGRFDPDGEPEQNKMSGRVYVPEVGDKQIILMTENIVPYMKIYFDHDVVSHFSLTLLYIS